MRFLTFLNNAWQSIERIDFVDFFNGAFRARILSGTLTANRSQTLPDKNGEIAVGIPLVGNLVLRSTANNGIAVGSATTASGSNFTAIGALTANSKTTGDSWTAIGFSAGQSCTDNGAWTAIGGNSGRSNTTGSNWTAIGVSAGQSNTIGTTWTAIGAWAAQFNTTGEAWTAIGSYAAQANINGNGWVAIGHNSGLSCTASNWFAMGQNAGGDITSGGDWICIGFNAGRGITTGEGNTIIGANITGLPATLTNTVIIGAGNGIPLLTADSTGLRLGTTVSNSAVSLINGSFSSRISASTLTANRTIANPDKSGTSVLAELPASFNTVVPLQGDTSFPTQAVTGAIGFTLSSAVKSACAKTTYRLTANGVNIPTFTGFTEASESLGYYNSNGILNTITFEWDGVTAWYRISQAKFAMPSTAIVGISFPLRSATTVINGTFPNIYESTTAEGQLYTSLMVSAQTIPAGKYGRITIGAHPLMAIGFNDSGALQTFANFEYGVFGSGTSIFTVGSAGGPAVNSGITISSTLERFYRLTRFSNGTVTAETSTDQTTWTPVITFGTTNTGTLYVAAALSGNLSTRFMRIVSFELEL